MREENRYYYSYDQDLSLLPWLGPLVYRDGVTPPLNPGHPPERAGESTRTPLISPEKLALPRPARGAPLAPSLAGSFRGTGGQWGPHLWLFCPNGWLMIEQFIPKDKRIWSPFYCTWKMKQVFEYMRSEKCKP